MRPSTTQRPLLLVVFPAFHDAAIPDAERLPVLKMLRYLRHNGSPGSEATPFQGEAVECATWKMKLAQDAYVPTYYRVIMKLGDILDGEFFTQYIKVGNIMMLSEGNMAQGNVFSLKDGILTMFLEKEMYERAGLVGQPHGVKGKRGLKPRWVQLSGMIYEHQQAFQGKRDMTAPDPDPLLQYFPTKYTSAPFFSEEIRVDTPSLELPGEALANGGRPQLEEFATDIYEWLSLVRLRSPRVESGDSIDSFLSRYLVPANSAGLQQATLCKVSWQGFIAPGWARQTLSDIILTISSRSWFSLSVTSLSQGIKGDSSDCTILRPPNAPGEYLLWDVHGHE
ncbi:putative Ribonuclease P 40kDa subunit [Seiridium unicorne]|uniref:Ribonuclease P 40kDa subunit n=1 Tax=Seiridium unicorne TaxID=138068 RepID=A0ABR2UDZ7_9PEZI